MRYHGGGLGFGIGGTASTVLTPTDDREAQRVMAGLHWVNKDGRPPLVPAEQAIP